MGRLLIALLAFVLLLPAAARAQEPLFAPDGVVMQADSLRYDQDTGVVTASGNVEMAHAGRILQADAVSYNEQADLVSASGNVVLLEPTGEVVFAEYAELTGDLREGAISGIRVLMAQNARFAANGARRIDGRITDMAKAIYSSCDLCEDDPTAAPLWQIKAARVVHDQALHDIIYYNAQFEVYGYPVFWTPYMRTPDPTVERRSGFLTPSYGSSSILGFTLKVPYYWNISPSKDATITPFITGDEGLVMIGQYRERTQTGIYTLNGSITRADPLGPSGEETGSKKWRGFVKADGIWHPDSTWQYGFDIYRASDDNYLSRYDFDNADTLTSQVFVEGFHDRSYASAFAYAFQGLRADDEPGDTPLVAPLIDYQLVSDPNDAGGFITIDANAMSLSRSDNTDSRRLTLKVAHEQPWVSDSGHVLIFRESLRGDAYQVNDVQISGQQPYSGFVGRLIPQASAEWRYPMVRQSGTMQQLVEPIVMTVISPNGGNDDRIPNEDSQEFEFDEVNLFNANRFPGYDRVEGGLRVNYGLRMGVFGFGGGRSELMVGQVWHARTDSTFEPETGLDGHFSDYVGRILITPTSYFDMAMRFRIDREDLTMRRNELNFGIGPESLRFDTSYVQLRDPSPDVVDTTGEREQIAFTVSAKPWENWTVRAEWRQDLTGEGTINYGGTLVYEDECVQFTGQLERRFTDDGFNIPETIFLFSVKLKTLG